jgi:SAM-dependent methyltransferase
MADDVAHKTPKGAVGTASEDRWLAIGKLQFDYLTGHGLTRDDRLLDLGCGNLRAGWRFIEWLEPDRYTGVDISPEIVIEANRTIVERGLQEKRPEIRLFDGLDLRFLPAGAFDVVHAHSVFSHTPPEVVTTLLSEAYRLLKPGGFFDFTYNLSETDETWGFLAEDYYYPIEVIIGMATEAGFTAKPAEGWSYKQDKIRAVVPATSRLRPDHGSPG